MMSKVFLYIVTAVGITLPLTLTACQTHSTADMSVSTPKDSAMTAQASDKQLTEQAIRIKDALATGDYAAITEDIHPIDGVRFSMYAYVRPDKDKTFSQEQFAQYLKQSKIRFTWGQKDGTGDLLITPLPAYLQTWVNASRFYKDQQAVTISVNESKAIGNSINNLQDVYPDADYVEFYHNGSETYSGLDWRALRLVFDEYQGKRYLVAVISDQWTS